MTTPAERIRRRKYYEDNREKLFECFKKNGERYRDRNRTFVAEYLKEHPCVDCGYSDTRALEFDHVRGVKLAPVSRLVQSKCSLKKIKEEIAKCEVRCANCHSIRTKEVNRKMREERQCQDPPTP